MPAAGEAAGLGSGMTTDVVATASVKIQRQIVEAERRFRTTLGLSEGSTYYRVLISP